MHSGVAMFPTEHALRPGALARAVEERGFESLWVTEHSHIPARREDAVARRRRAAEEVLRTPRSVRLARDARRRRRAR